MNPWRRRLEHVATFPWPLRLSWWGSVLLVLLGAGYPFSIGPGLERLQHARLMGESLMARHAAEVAALEPSRRLDEQVQQARQALQEMHWQLAAGDGTSELIAQLASHGHRYGLRFERIDVKDEQAGEGYRVVPVHLEVAGAYPMLRRWLDEWLGQLRLLRVERLHARPIDPAAATTTLRWQMVVHAYQSEQTALPMPASLAHQPARADEPWAGNDPFQAVGSHRAHGLTRLPLEQLEMVGVLARHGQYQAILDEKGYLHRVAVGARLGREGGRVLSIDAQRVVVGEPVSEGWEGQRERRRELRLRDGKTKDETDEWTRMGDGRSDDGGHDSKSGRRSG
ncbi:type 4a pilus biogenesis protein PilO [Pseudomonas entomophila]|jgi:type IV pilus assembly protein PilP|uniref:pilus assembly protein PilP n=1 Tax=Pseudomonas entomophila TaxID=312306 RepID=UPI0015E3ADA5|nr:pilus assembly protein PilP [Pseudomonas entomophila]MBA1194147.1 type 4a pilus biogenesis protein PilO [Pseudomonas entomophila]